MGTWHLYLYLGRKLASSSLLPRCCRRNRGRKSITIPSAGSQVETFFVFLSILAALFLSLSFLHTHSALSPTGLCVCVCVSTGLVPPPFLFFVFFSSRCSVSTFIARLETSPNQFRVYYPPRCYLMAEPMKNPHPSSTPLGAHARKENEKLGETHAPEEEPRRKRDGRSDCYSVAGESKSRLWFVIFSGRFSSRRSITGADRRWFFFRR